VCEERCVKQRAGTYEELGFTGVLLVGQYLELVNTIEQRAGTCKESEDTAELV